MSTLLQSPVKHEQYNQQEYIEGAEGDASYMESDRSIELAEAQWRAITKIVRDVGPTLLPDDELGDLAAAEAAVNAKENDRGAIVDKLQEELRLLTRQHQAAEQAAQRPATHPSPAEHDAQVRNLEQKQHSLGKSLNEEQSTVAKRESELIGAKQEQEEVGAMDIGEDDWVDGKALRLKLLADAGFTLIPSKDDGPAKILIRNDAKDDIHTISVDKNRSKCYYSNLIWSLASD